MKLDRALALHTLQPSTLLTDNLKEFANPAFKILIGNDFYVRVRS